MRVTEPALASTQYTYVSSTATPSMSVPVAIE
jgi:hypothetical protein